MACERVGMRRCAWMSSARSHGHGYGYGYILGPSPVPPQQDQIYLAGSFGPVLACYTYLQQAVLPLAQIICAVCTSVHLCASPISYRYRASPLSTVRPPRYASSFSPGSTDPAISPCMQYQRPTLADAAAPLNRTTCALLDKGSTRCRCYTHTPLTLRTLSLSHTHACRQSGRTGRCREPCSRCARRARQPPTRSRPGHAHAFS